MRRLQPARHAREVGQRGAELTNEPVVGCTRLLVEQPRRIATLGHRPRRTVTLAAPPEAYTPYSRGGAAGRVAASEASMAA